MHHDPVFSKKSGGAEKLADGDPAADLINQIATAKCGSHRDKIGQTAIRVINKLPPIPGHEFREGLAEVGQAVDQNTPPRLRNNCKRRFGPVQFMN
jgi:hypothetical protein